VLDTLGDAIETQHPRRLDDRGDIGVREFVAQHVRGQRRIESSDSAARSSAAIQSRAGKVEVIQRHEAALLAALFDETLCVAEKSRSQTADRNAEAQHVGGQAGFLEVRRKLLEELRCQAPKRRIPAAQSWPASAHRAPRDAESM
jgi:hypothetical protein